MIGQGRVIAPRLTVTYRGTTYPIYQRGEAWVIEVAGGTYFLTAGDNPTPIARMFLGLLPRNSIYPKLPAWIASPHYPLILDVDGTIVRVWPTLPARDDPPKTYEHPYWKHRVVALGKQPIWMFAARGRKSSAGGDIPPKGDQTVADLEELARQWLAATRSA